MDYFAELMRISATLPNKADSNILKMAAGRLIPGPELKFIEVKRVPGFGYIQHKLYYEN